MKFLFSGSAAKTLESLEDESSRNTVIDMIDQIKANPAAGIDIEMGERFRALKKNGVTFVYTVFHEDKGEDVAMVVHAQLEKPSVFQRMKKMAIGNR